MKVGETKNHRTWKILKIYIILILKIRLHSTCVALEVFREVIILKESQFGGLIWRLNCEKMEKLLVRI